MCVLAVVAPKTMIFENNCFFAIFVRTDLRIDVSGAKFDAEAEFDVLNCLAPPKSRKNYRKLIPETQKNRIFSESFFRLFDGRQAS